MVFTWLPLSANAEILHPSSTTSTNVSGPTHLVVGPVSTVEGTSGKEATFVVSSRPGSLGQASCFSGPPLGSLNYPCAKHERPHDVGNPLQSVQNPHTRNICALAFGNNSWPVSCEETVLQCNPEGAAFSTESGSGGNKSGSMVATHPALVGYFL